MRLGTGLTLVCLRRERRNCNRAVVRVDVQDGKTTNREVKVKCRASHFGTGVRVARREVLAWEMTRCLWGGGQSSLSIAMQGLHQIGVGKRTLKSLVLWGRPFSRLFTRDPFIQQGYPLSSLLLVGAPLLCPSYRQKPGLRRNAECSTM